MSRRTLSVRVRAGEPDEYVAVARRAGDAWYISAMSDDGARTLPCRWRSWRTVNAVMAPGGGYVVRLVLNLRD